MLIEGGVCEGWWVGVIMEVCLSVLVEGGVGVVWWFGVIMNFTCLC